jgi:hypothetical protein
MGEPLEAGGLYRSICQVWFYGLGAADAAADKYRENIEPNLKNGVGRHYFLGKDVYDNEFKDHQKP